MPPPLNAHGPGIPDQRRAGVAPHQLRRRIGQLLPAAHLHPEPVVHQRVPEVLLALEEVPIGTVEREMRRSVRDQTCCTHALALPGGHDYKQGCSGSNRAMKIGYFLSSEEWGPTDLVELAHKAEQARFEGL